MLRLGDELDLLEETLSVTTAHHGETETTNPTRRRGAAALLAMVLLAIALAGCLPSDSQSFVDRTNSLRQSKGIAPLATNGTLTKKAEDWAQRMASTGRLEHSTLSAGLSSLDWTALGENVGYSSPTSDTYLTIHNAFVRSSAHYANLVNRRFTHMGVGVAKDSSGRVWVAEVFADL
jgi:uncharacterized protein YkwD